MNLITLEAILSDKVSSLHATDSVGKALDVMERYSASSVIIVDDENRPIGIFTEHDALRIVAEERDPRTSLPEVMSSEPFCVLQTMQLHDAYITMEEQGFRHLIVVDESGQLAGVVSEGDFLRHIGFDHLGKFKIVAQAMSDSLLIVEPKMSLVEAAALMNERKCDYAVVLEGSRPVGVVTERDIARECAHEGILHDETVAHLLRSDIQIVDKNIPLHEAASIMEQHGIHQLIVVDGQGNLAGLLSRHDVLHAVHGAYFEFLIRVIDKKSATIAKMSEYKKSLRSEKKAIEKSELKLRKLFAALPDGIVLLDSVSMLPIEYNAAVYITLGYTSEEFSRLAISDYEVIESPEETKQRINNVIQRGSDSFETRHRTKEGDVLDVWVNVVAVELDEHPCLLALYRDITEQKRTERHLHERQLELVQKTSLLNTLVNTIPNLVWLKDPEGVYLACNEMFEGFFGAKESEIIGKTDFDFVSREQAEFFRENDRLAIAADQPRSNEEFLVFADGTKEGYFEAIKTPMKDHAGKVIGVLGISRDITERKHYEEKLETLANYDPLTGLANRALLLAHLYRSIEKAKRLKSQIALLMFDLDRFKDVNDSFGHGAGDELLKQVAQRFEGRLREGDLISRLGGDEFAIVLESIAHPEDAGRIAEEMIVALGTPYKLSGGASVHIGMSVGIVLFPDHGDNASELLQHADAALYKAKAEGRATYRYYTDELTDSARKRIEGETRLRRAIINNEFEVYYQPQVHIATGRIVGAEALIRWNDPHFGIVSPTEFIPIAENTGLIGPIGEWVLNETCRQGKIWLDHGHRLTLAVNLSAHQVRHQNIPEMVEAALKKTGYPADKLELELTESALMQRQEETVAMLHTLRAMGIRLAIDDFGTGYSSLSYLKRFPIDVLKIDKSFVDDLPFDNDDMAIVTAIIAMGKALGFQILAEGTERPEQIEFLKERGCTMYQGYFKSPPVPAAEFEKLLS